MTSETTPEGKQPTIQTERLYLRLADPFSTPDCQELIRIQTGSSNAVSSVQTEPDIRRKFKQHGPRPEFCTLNLPPRGHFFLIYLPSEGRHSENKAYDSERDLVGHILLSFRPEMPYPDLGFALLRAYEGQGYAFEAAQAVLRFWQEEIGIKGIYIGTAPYNMKAQKLAERLGFVKAGSFDVVFGHPPNEKRETDGVALVLPGMTWVQGKTLMLTLREETDP